ncbi:hypothetical protein [Bifidobacterium cuniculi]|uniref:Uncharacterized protein n=1 Tax=Bifidobacterium cuniculi TaxID=1688 RepID=A0A087AKJ6_9BIFI|nr:hypothetical protein [Bifidobacterium cuniculi]KFI59296.1 hypothetical protein BCUN_1637 [Bifidobacterium cuniculi]
MTNPQNDYDPRQSYGEVPPYGQQSYGEAQYGQQPYAPAYEAPQYQRPYAAQPVQAYASQGYAMSDSDRTLRLVAFIFMLISTVGLGWAIIPLAWMIPMTVVSWGIYKGTRPNSVAFGVCSLIFCSLVAGICLLISTKEK